MPKAHEWSEGGGALTDGQIVLLMSSSSTVGCPDSVTLFLTAVERARCGAHKLFRIGEVPTTVASILLVVADGLFGLCGSERLGRAIHR